MLFRCATNKHNTTHTAAALICISAAADDFESKDLSRRRRHRARRRPLEVAAAASVAAAWRPKSRPRSDNTDRSEQTRLARDRKRQRDRISARLTIAPQRTAQSSLLPVLSRLPGEPIVLFQTIGLTKRKQKHNTLAGERERASFPVSSSAPLSCVARSLACKHGQLVEQFF